MLVARLGERTPDPAGIGDLVRHAQQCASGTVLLDASALPATAREPVGDHAHVAELGAGAEAAAEQSVAGHDRAADARADGEHHHVADHSAGAEAELRPAGGVGVVVDDDGLADAGLELLAERLVAPVDVRRVVDRRLGGVDETCGGDADRGNLLFGCERGRSWRRRRLRASPRHLRGSGRARCARSRRARRRLHRRSSSRRCRYRSRAPVEPPFRRRMRQRACSGRRPREQPLECKRPHRRGRAATRPRRHARCRRSYRDRILHASRGCPRPRGERHRPARRPLHCDSRPGAVLASHRRRRMVPRDDP